ncbi:uncharacterized protein LOC127635495 [Xyrauchen texanus]|uniref:uncharacterized protein LOC127635495 n=1 Tax=Xyrauchen texanus TaxID=154827 RepID=UPI002241DC71|nr:uncharacterized protein LOC127635495 [Xyrauchen texanus]
MERRKREETAEGSTSHQPKLSGAMALRNFTIPRTSGEVLLEHCPEESQDYSLIRSKLRDSRLDMSKDLATTWQWKDACLVHNEELLRKFSEKRAEMCAKGRHGKEMEETFCFIVASDQMTAQICQHGLRVSSTVQHALGKPSHGVYVFRHVDVALKSTTSISTANNLLIFKVLYGKVKKIAQNSDLNKTQDPTFSFDCHMLKEAVSHRDRLHQQVLGSSVFLFDFNGNQELNERPRQCVPYAVVSFVSASSAILTSPTISPISPSALPVGPVHETVDCFKACTVAERRGNEDTGTITCKHFGTPVYLVPDYTPQNPGTEVLFQNMENTVKWISASHESVPKVDRTALSQSLLEKETFSSNQRLNTLSTNEVYDNECDTTPGSLSKSTETNQQTKYSKAETTYFASGFEGRQCKSDRQNQEENCGFARTESGPKEPLNMDMKNDQINKCFSLQSSMNNCGHSLKQKAETLPSMKLFKMKFQKYSAYFRLNEEQRREKIWSLENMSPEQKQALMDHVHFYEVYYHKYKKGLLSQKYSETQKASRLCERENLILHTTENTYNQNPSNVCQTKTYGAASLSDKTDFTHREKCIETKHPDNPKSSTVMLVEKKLDLLPETHRDYVDHHDGLVESPGKLSELASMNHTLTDKRSDAQIVQSDPKQSQEAITSHSIEGKIHLEIVCQGEVSTSVIESSVIESAPGVNIVEGTHPKQAVTYANNITALDIASCVVVSSCGASEDCSLNPVMAVTQELNGQNQKRDTTCTEGPKISGELDMEDNNTHRELYARLQLDQLLPSKNGKHIFSARAYLTPRVMGRPMNTMAKPEIYIKYHCKDMKCREDLNVTIKANKTAYSKQTLSLSERFSKNRSLQKWVTGLMSKFSNSKIIQNPETQIASSEEHKETVTRNCKLIQLLAQRYNNAKLYAKYRSLSRQGNKNTCIQKLIRSLRRTKCVKKRHFWKENNCTMSSESSHSAVHGKVTSNSSNSLSHASDKVLTESKDDEPDPNLEIMSHTSHADSDRQWLYIQGCQEGITCKSQLQDHCSPTKSATNKDLTLKPTAPLSFDSIYSNKEKPTEDMLMVDEMEQVQIAKNSPNQNQSLMTCARMLDDSRKDCRSTITYEGSMSQELISETESVPLGGAEHNTMKKSVEDNVKATKGLSLKECKVSGTNSNMTESNAIRSHTSNLQKNMTPELKRMDTNHNKIKTETEVSIRCDSAMGNIKNNETNGSVETSLNFQRFDKGEMPAKACCKNTPNKNLSTSTNRSTHSSAWSIDTEITMANSQEKVLFGEKSSDSKHCVVEAFECTSDNVVDLTADDPTSSGNETNLSGISTSNTKRSSTVTIEQNGNLSRPEQNKNCDEDSPETQLISKLRDYLTKFESTVKKHDTVHEDLKQKPVAWITLDSTAHKQQLAEKGQNNIVNFPNLMPQGSDSITTDNSRESSNNSAQTRMIPGIEHVPTANNIYLLVPAGSKRGRRSSQTKSTNRLVSKSARRGLVASDSPDITSSLDTVKDNIGHLALAQLNNRNPAPTEISINTPSAKFWMQSKNTIGQQNPIICSQDSVNMDSLFERKTQANQSLDTIEIIDDGNVSSTFAESVYSVNDISNTLKMADQTISLTELGSLQSKCKRMLQHFISSFEKDQKVKFKQSFVSRHLIFEQYLDHPPAQVDLKYEAVNSYLELQMMMETWQFVDNKINFLSGKPTFRSLLYYDPSLYGELYKGEVGFQQQSSLFASFQKILVQEGYSKLQEYYIAVSSLHQKLHAASDASYYMYLKSKRELLEVEAVLRNPRDVNSFFLSVPLAAMINFGDNLENLEKVHKLLITFVETPSDLLTGTFDEGKAEHLSIMCRYLQEKAFFIRSCKEMVSKVPWFGIEHLLYDASKVLIWQDMEQGVPSEVLKKYKSSNPQIILGVTESGITLMNKVEQPPPSMFAAETPAHKQINAARKHKGLQLLMSPQPTVGQSLNAEKEAAYKMAKRRVSHPPITPCNINNNEVNPLFKMNPATHIENPTPYKALPQKPSQVHWGKKRVSLSRFDQRTASADIQRAQRPSTSAPQATLPGDSGVKHTRIESVKHQQICTSHCPVLSKDQVNQFTLATTQPYSLPHFPLNTTSVPPPSLSLKAFPNTMMHVPVPGTITAINYPYFLLNGQTYTTSSTAAFYPDTR